MRKKSIAMFCLYLIILMPFYSSAVFGQAVTITEPETTNFTDTSTTISVNTNTPTNATVFYGTNNTFNFSVTNAQFTTVHNIAIPTDKDETYNYRVTACTDQGSCATSGVGIFIAGADTTPPFINVTIPEVVSRSSVDILGNTEPYTEVQFYVNGNLERVNTRETVGETGEIKLYSLTLPATQNTLRIFATDNAGNTAEENYNIEVDRTPPTITLTSFLGVSNSPNFLVSGNVDEETTLLFFTKLELDNAPPDRLSMLTTKSISPNSVELQWNAADEDDIGEYLIYRDDMPIGKTTDVSYTDNTVASGTSYNFRVSAMDTSCNEAPLSTALSVQMPTGGNVNVSAPQRMSATCKLPAFNITSTGTFAQTLTLPEGPSTITVKGTDRAGNTATITNRTYYDQSPPIIESHNLGGLTPSYVDEVTIRGKVSEKATVFVYINGIVEYTIITDDDGNFAKEIELKKDVTVSDINVASGVFAGAGASVSPSGASGQSGTAWENNIELEAVDQANQKSQRVSSKIMRAVCGFGSWFSVNVDKPTPSSLNPRLILEGQAEIGFNVRMEYLGGYEAVFQGKPRFGIRPVSQEESKKWDVGIGSPYTVWSPDKKVGYFKFSINPPAFPSNMTTSQKEENISKHNIGNCEIIQDYVGCYRIPLELEIQFQEKQPSYGAQITGVPGPIANNRVQKQCIDVEIPVDLKLPISSEIPLTFLNTTVQALNDIIDTIDNIIEPLEQVFAFILHACLVGWAVTFGLSLRKAYQCDVQKFTSGMDMEIAKTGLCEQAYGGEEGDDTKLNACTACQSAIFDSQRVVSGLNQLCDRIWCPSAPTLKKYIMDKKRGEVTESSAKVLFGGTSLLQGSSCAADEIDPTNVQSIRDVYNAYKVHSKDKRTDSGFKGTYPVENKDWTKLTSDEFSCGGLHPLNPACCGNEYMQEYGSVCGVGTEALFNEIRESYCYASQNLADAGDEIDADCKGARNLVNKISGVCEASQGKGLKLVNTGLKYKKETKPSTSTSAAAAATKPTATTTTKAVAITGGAIADITGGIFLNATRRVIKYNDQGKIDTSSTVVDMSEFDSTCNLPESADSTIVYVNIRPTKDENQVLVHRGFAVKGHKIADTGIDSDKVGGMVQLIGQTNFIANKDLTTYFKTNKNGQLPKYTAAFKKDLCDCLDNSCNEKKAKQIFEEIKSKIITDDKAYIVDPTSGFLRSLQCLCIPGIISYLKLWKGVLSAVRNCFATILITGDGSEGVCEAVISTYVCDMIWDLIKCFFSSSGKGLSRPAGLDGGGLLSKISEAGSMTQAAVQGRYGSTSLFQTMFVDQKLVHAVCLFAFTGTWKFNVDALVDQGLTTPPIDSQPFMHPAQRRYISFDPVSKGITTHNYHVGVGLVAGSDLTYKLELVCSNDYTCNPGDGFQGGKCDCNELGTEQRRPLPIPGQTGSLKQGGLLSEEIFSNIVAPYRYDKVIFSYQYRDANNEIQTKSIQRSLAQKGGAAPAFCQFDIIELSFLCSLGFGDNYVARFPRDPYPDYPGEQEYFKSNDDIIFNVPIVQRYPDSLAYGFGSDSNHTKYLIFNVKNHLQATIGKDAKNYNTCDPSVRGADVTQANCNTNFKEEYKLNQQGERTVVVNVGPLTPEKFAIATSQDTDTTQKLPYNLRAYINPTEYGRLDKSVIFEVDIGKKYRVFTAKSTDLNSKNIDKGVYTTSKTGVFTEVKGATTLVDNKGEFVSAKGRYAIELPNWDAVAPQLSQTEKSVIQIKFPPIKEEKVDVAKECGKFATDIAIWTASFEIHDATAHAGGFHVGPHVSYDSNSAPQRIQIQFNVLCSDQPVAPTPAPAAPVTPQPAPAPAAPTVPIHQLSQIGSPSKQGTAGDIARIIPPSADVLLTGVGCRISTAGKLNVFGYYRKFVSDTSGCRLEGAPTVVAEGFDRKTNGQLETGAESLINLNDINQVVGKYTIGSHDNNKNYVIQGIGFGADISNCGPVNVQYRELKTDCSLGEMKSAINNPLYNAGSIERSVAITPGIAVGFGMSATSDEITYLELSDKRIEKK